MNHVAERLTGYTAHEAMDHPVDEIFRIIHEKTRTPVEAPIQKVLKSDIVGPCEPYTLISRDGTGHLDLGFGHPDPQQGRTAHRRGHGLSGEHLAEKSPGPDLEPDLS